MMFNASTMEVICERENLFEALHRVRSNKGSEGVDGMSVDELSEHLKHHWLQIKAELLSGDYRPQPVKRVSIPKPGKADQVRQLGIPTVLDRFIQQAILQVLQAKWDATFSDSNYGFRQGRSAHQAIAQAQSYVEEGFAVVVDIDLENFFDRVNHDRLMSRLSCEIADKRVLKLIGRYLRAGVAERDSITVSREGVPQGGPLSPFLSNVVLDEWDKELERRGHRFVRYGDDCNIYVRSHRAGERVMSSSRRFITQRLKLKVNDSKSAVDIPSKRQFLGFTLTCSSRSTNKRKIAPDSVVKFKRRIRELTRRNTSISLEARVGLLSRYLIGWRSYFGFCETPSTLSRLDSWIRRRMRSVIWYQWRTYRRRARALRSLGVEPWLVRRTLRTGGGPWKLSRNPGVMTALNNDYFQRIGLPSLLIR